ncbi:MAG: RNA 2'-phosphotransferase [Clostridia bacterium]|nr:RNA 2'-phosphotransferase [Clostridia bacterium]
MKTMTEISKLIAMVLRHKPERLQLTLDEHGWCDAEKLVQRINNSQPFTMEMLEQIVAEDGKQRYSFNGDHTMIRANQGHSVPVDVELPVKEPPAVLYHGTAERFLPSIRATGLEHRSRLYVHLSADEQTAQVVGKRHGTPAVLVVEAGRMAGDGYRFFLSANGVWLTEAVPVQYIVFPET